MSIPTESTESVMTKLEKYWLAGILEGEGSFMAGPPSAPNQPRISLQMTDEDVVQKVAILLGVNYRRINDRRNPKWKPTYAALVRGRRAAVIMQELHQLMGSRRKEQINSALVSYVPRAPGDNSRKLDDRNVTQIVRMLKTHSVSEVARQFSVSRTTIRRRVKKLCK